MKFNTTTNFLLVFISAKKPICEVCEIEIIANFTQFIAIDFMDMCLLLTSFWKSTY